MSKIFVEDTWGIIETELEGSKALDYNLYEHDGEVYITFYGNFNGQVDTKDCKGHYKLVEVQGDSDDFAEPLDYMEGR